jgi:hypothetical protein
MGSRSFGRWAVAVLLLLAAPAADTRDTRADVEPAPSLPRWLVGHWVLERDGKTIEENWTDAAGGRMFSVGRTLKGDRLVEFEFVRIETRPEGMFYVAQPQGAPPTDFKLTQSDGKSLRFENPGHDFPQIVRYWTDGPDRLHAEVSAAVEGKEHAQRFDYRRVSCPLQRRR